MWLSGPPRNALKDHEKSLGAGRASRLLDLLNLQVKKLKRMLVLLFYLNWLWGPRRQSHVKRQTSHVTRHTSHVACHTSRIARHTSHVTRQTSHVQRHTSYGTCISFHVKHRTSHVSRHTSHVARHTLHVTRHSSRYAPLDPFWLFSSAQHMHPSLFVRRRPPEYESGHRFAPASRVSPKTRASCAARHQFWLLQIFSVHCAACHLRLRNPRTAPLHQQPFFSTAVDACSQNLRHFELGI